MSIPDKTDQGQHLTRMQAAFVSRYLENGKDAEEAAKHVGSKDPVQYARAALRVPAVQAAISSDTRGELVAAASEGVGVVLSILRNPDTSDKWARIKLDAVKTLWDRVGIVHVESNAGKKQQGALDDMSDEKLEEILQHLRAGDGARVVNGEAIETEPSGGE